MLADDSIAQVKTIDEIAVLHISCLRHEPVDYTVKHDVVVFARPCEFFHAFAVPWGHIRQKLGDERYIVTVRGVGYRFEKDWEERDA